MKKLAALLAFLSPLLMGSVIIFVANPPGAATTEWAHGSSYQIDKIDTNFPSKATAGPLIWDDFEGCTDGSNIFGRSPVIENMAGSWTWDTFTVGGSPQTEPKCETTLPGRSGKEGVLLYYANGQYSNALEFFFDRDTAGQVLYVWFDHYYDVVQAYSRNVKPWLFYGTESGTLPMTYNGWGCAPADDGMRNSNQKQGTCSFCASCGATIWGSNEFATYAEDKWQGHEIFLEVSSTDTNDGEFRVTMHDFAPSEALRTQQEDTTYQNTCETEDYWTQFHIIAYVSAGDEGACTGTEEYNVYVDFVYVDDTQIRVVICDNAVFASATKCVIQPATAWSTTQITVTAHKGEFATDDVAHVIVLDANNNVVQQDGSDSTLQITWQ